MKPAPPWSPPGLADFADGYVLAFDQTLTSCGACLLLVSGGRITATPGMIRPRSDLASFAGTFARAQELKTAVRDMLDRTQPDHVACEMPAVHGHRTESSLIAAYVIHDLRPDAVMVSAMHAHQVLAGTPRREATAKQEIAAAVARYVPDSVGRKWNEHMRDALATGLTRLRDIRSEEAAA